MTPSEPSTLPADLDRTVRAVVLSQLLFTAGNVLTTGGFLYYYAQEAFTTTTFQFSILLILPELAGTCGIFSRPITRWVGSRKWTWLGCLLISRVFAIGVPLTAVPLLTHERAWPFSVLVGWVAGWYVFQGIAYAAYISWLSDLVPKSQWGRLFARRKIAQLSIMIFLPVVAGFLKRYWDTQYAEGDRLIAYVVIFVTGTVLILTAILPLLRLPDVPVAGWQRRSSSSIAVRSMLRVALADRSFRWLLMHSWWLSFFQGLTQAPFYRYSVQVLHVPVETYYVMSSVMLALQFPSTHAAGRLSDTGHDKSTLFWSVMAVSASLLFWMAATPDRWWLLFGAYALWGLFGFVNISGRNLMLKLAPSSDNVTHFALFRQVGGMFAAIAGLIGGLWLDRLLSQEAAWSIGEMTLGPFQILFLVSFLGRAAAGLWLLPIRDPK